MTTDPAVGHRALQLLDTVNPEDLEPRDRLAYAQVLATLDVAITVDTLDSAVRDLHETLRSYHR